MPVLILLIACGCSPANQESQPSLVGNSGPPRTASPIGLSVSDTNESDFMKLEYEKAAIYEIMSLFDSGNRAKYGLTVAQLDLLERVLDQDSRQLFDQFSDDPPELQFSCAVSASSGEESWATLLKEGDARTQNLSARVLWQRHSRRHAKAVIEFVDNTEADQETVRPLRIAIDTSFQPNNIRRELEHGDYRWGCWLAFLRPNRDLVPSLLDGLKTKAEFLPETLLALGNSKDPRAYEPLLELIKTADTRNAGDAAGALGLLGNPNAEPHLIQALSSENGWLRVKACRALSFVGTRNSIPELTRLANNDRYTGALAIRRVARYAIDRIAEREEP